MKRIRKQIYDVLEVAPEKEGFSWYFDLFLTTLIILNIAALILESVPSLDAQYHDAFLLFELFSVIVFSVEYFLRLWAAVEDYRYRDPVAGRVRYALTPLALIDLFAILPFYLALLPVDLRYFRIMRLFRLFRLFKIARYVLALNFIGHVVREKREQLIVSIVFMLFMLLFVSCTMYYLENEAQPEAFSSIPATMWWGVATLTTVGYGDVYPITPMGKFLGGIIAILGIGLFALPTGILASGFSEALDRRRRIEQIHAKGEVCPHCGEQLG